MDPVQTAWLFIAQWEGFRPTPYLDTAKRISIGFGRTGPDVTFATAPTTKEAEETWTKARLAWLWQRIDRDVGRDLNVNQAAALISFAYNCGLAALERSTLWGYVQAGQWLPAASQFVLWDHVTKDGVKTTDPGLYKRRLAEKALFLSDPPAVS